MTAENRLAAVVADYDPRADVLYVFVGKPVPCEGEGAERGLELDFNFQDGKPCGATVIGFRRHGWHDDLQQLSRRIADHLGAREQSVLSAIQTAVIPSK